MIMERNVNETRFFIKWIERRIKSMWQRRAIVWPMGFCTFGFGDLHDSLQIAMRNAIPLLSTWAALQTSLYIYIYIG